MQMQQVTRGWLIYDLTQSPLALALVVVSFALPMFLFSLIGGVLADRLPKRILITTSQSFNALSGFLIGALVLMGGIKLWHLLLVGVINGSLLAMNGPSRMAIIPEIVPRDRLVSAIALGQAGMNMTRIAGPAIAGILISLINVSGVYWIISILYLFSSITIMKVTRTEDPDQDWSRWKFGREYLRGPRYVLENPLLLSLMGMAFVAVLLGMPYQFLMPAYVVEALGGSSQQLGYLMMMTGIGALIGSLGSGIIGQIRRKGALLMLSILIWSISLFAFSISHLFTIALTTLLLIGATSAMFMTFNTSIIQLLTTRELYGRIMSINMMTFGMMPLAVLPIGLGAERFGTPNTLAAAALLLIIAAVLFLVFNKKVRELEL